MSFYFRPFPTVRYSQKKNNNFELLTNITLRYKVKELVKRRKSIYYDYVVKDSDRPDIIAYKYYDDETLDWVLFLINDIIDPYYDWPLTQEGFNAYMKSLYGSVSTSQTTIYEYRKILSAQSVRNDGSVIPKRTVVVDLNTYNSLAAADKEIIYAYDYYLEQNDAKRRIKILDKRFVGQLIRDVEVIFSEIE
tara:strand:+ start:88 stop:663 length:576 start_codon:yes stop_codon:yes gene_type:complete